MLPVFIPFVLVSVALVAMGAFYVRGRPPSAGRSTALLAMIAVLFVMPFAFECIVAAALRRPNVLWVDLHLQWLAIPVVIAFISAQSVLRKDPNRGGVLPLLSWAGLTGVVNTVNQCQPGWCGRYGFPLAYFSWSDAMVGFNGDSQRPFSLTAAIVDSAVVVSGAVLIWKFRPKADASPD